MTTIVRAHDVARTDHAHATDLMRPEVEAMQALLGELPAAEWLVETDCPGWTVRGVVSHLIGNAEVTLDNELMARRVREGTERYPRLPLLNAMNEAAVDGWRDRQTNELATEFTRLWWQLLDALPSMPDAVRDRMFDSGYPDVPPVSLGYVVDVVLTRDMWMHRIDICRATGRTFATHAHDRGVVEQVLRDLDDEWAGPAFVLHLTGAVPGDWQIGDDAPVAALQGDALGVMRSLSGRRAPEANVTVHRGEPGLAPTLQSARVIF
ncbi:maleylpyruvate isomerase family mycothiol-dependent enzyme [Saccharopolyspora thermophila]|uniref:Mycothiol-dependent maleylpyruvate isomerase metal-binding domain-containing protein n=1 Tax=Saccharopolyspora thermophila TaxID=89367 RepID=A0ABN1BQ69_9PSEU